MLLAVIAGALALAGVIASVLFRLGRARRAQIGARRRRAIWESVDDQTAPSVIPPWVEPGTEQSAPVRADTLSSSRAQSSAAQERYQKIEEILAELVKQAQLDSEAVSSDRHVSS
jgi:hypothetical protein